MGEAPIIAVVEDDAAIRNAIVDILTSVGYEVISAPDGEAGLELATKRRYHLLLLDLVLPSVSGFEILAELKKSRPGQAVIILSARGEEADRVKGLQLGADDYVVKPFSVRELIARVEAVLRRSTERHTGEQELRFPEGVAHLANRELVFTDGNRSDLAEKEVRLLAYFSQNRGRIVSRDELIRAIWNLDPKHIDTRTVDMHISNLRKKLRDTSPPTLLLTVRGQGYRLALEPNK